MSKMDRPQFLRLAKQLFSALHEAAEVDSDVPESFEFHGVWYDYDAPLVALFDSLDNKVELVTAVQARLKILCERLVPC